MRVMILGVKYPSTFSFSMTFKLLPEHNENHKEEDKNHLVRSAALHRLVEEAQLQKILIQPTTTALRRYVVTTLTANRRADRTFWFSIFYTKCD